jgi:hypothetical protein
MKVAIILYSEKQRLFETIGLSANMVTEIVDHLVDITQGQLRHFFFFFRIEQYSVVPDKKHRFAEFAVLI